MSKHFALVGSDGEVKQVIVADHEYVDSHSAEDFEYKDLSGNIVTEGPGAKWVETSMDGSVTKHYAGIGYEFHEDIKEFTHKKPFPSWVRDDEKAEYKAPVEKPKTDEEFQKWDESKQKWHLDEDTKQKEIEAKNLEDSNKNK
jgi:hypothetical protein